MSVNGFGAQQGKFFLQCYELFLQYEQNDNVAIVIIQTFAYFITWHECNQSIINKKKEYFKLNNYTSLHIIYSLLGGGGGAKISWNRAISKVENCREPISTFTSVIILQCLYLDIIILNITYFDRIIVE